MAAVIEGVAERLQDKAVILAWYSPANPLQYNVRLKSVKMFSHFYDSGFFMAS